MDTKTHIGPLVQELLDLNFRTDVPIASKLFIDRLLKQIELRDKELSDSYQVQRIQQNIIRKQEQELAELRQK